MFLGNGGKFLGGEGEQAGDEHGFGDAARLVLRGLEGLARGVGEAVEVQAVVPVGAANQRQSMRAEALQCIGEAALEMAELIPGRQRATLAADRGYDAREFVEALFSESENAQESASGSYAA